VKFLVTKELWYNPLLKWLVVLLVAIFSFFLLLDMLLHHYQIGLEFSKAIETIMGNEEEFTDPILFDALLERVHIDIFTSTVTLMLLAIIYVRVAPQSRIKSLPIHLSFVTAILSHVALMGGFYAGEFLIQLWIVLFVIWHIIALGLSLYIIGRLVFK